jgi:hypothetical protein
MGRPPLRFLGDDGRTKACARHIYMVLRVWVTLVSYGGHKVRLRIDTRQLARVQVVLVHEFARARAAGHCTRPLQPHRANPSCTDMPSPQATHPQPQIRHLATAADMPAVAPPHGPLQPYRMTTRLRLLDPTRALPARGGSPARAAPAPPTRSARCLYRPRSHPCRLERRQGGLSIQFIEGVAVAAEQSQQ